MHRLFIPALILSAACAAPLHAKDTAKSETKDTAATSETKKEKKVREPACPKGYKPFSKIKEAIAHATARKALLVVALGGKVEACIHCQTALDTGSPILTSASAVKIWSNTETMQSADKTDLPETMRKTLEAHKVTGFYMVFYVFNSDGTQLITTAGRDKLDENPKGTLEFRKTVMAAKKAEKEAKKPAVKKDA